MKLPFRLVPRLWLTLALAGSTLALGACDSKQEKNRKEALETEAQRLERLAAETKKRAEEDAAAAKRAGEARAEATKESAEAAAEAAKKEAERLREQK
ncbi:MAG: hypothetical protein JSR82_13070 [Verrucomicrobia bacterium]|nr:hypothetical protein [Verrucomicrobiota bacterium]